MQNQLGNICPQMDIWILMRNILVQDIFTRVMIDSVVLRIITSYDTKKFKFKSLSQRISSWKERGSRTFHGRRADRPALPGGPSLGSPRLFARVTKARRATGCSGGNFGLSAPGCQIVRTPSGLFAGASRTVCVCHAQVGPGPRVAKSSRQSLSSCSLSRKGPSWGFWLELSSNRPSTSTKSPPCHPGILSNLSLIYSDWARRWLGFEVVIWNYSINLRFWFGECVGHTLVMLWQFFGGKKHGIHGFMRDWKLQTPFSCSIWLLQLGLGTSWIISNDICLMLILK
jgi:hypothetical protein